MNLRKLILITLLNLLLFNIVHAQNNYLLEGVNLYKAGRYDSAIERLEQVKKNDKDAYLAFHYIGLSYDKRNKLNKAKKAFKKSIDLNPNYSNSKISLAYVYIKLLKFKDAAKIAEKAKALDADNYQVSYILSMAYSALGQDQKVIENIDKLIELKPDLAEAYLMKYEATKIDDEIKPKSPEYFEAIEQRQKILVKYLKLLAGSSAMKFTKSEREALSFFINFYEEKFNSNDKRKPSDDYKGMKIIKKPFPDRNAARRGGKSGEVRLLTTFQSDGQIGHIFVLRSVGYGLDERAIEAAKKIEFVPPQRNGKPETVVRTIVYKFSSY